MSDNEYKADEETIGHILRKIEKVRAARDIVLNPGFIAYEQDTKTAKAIDAHLDRLERAYLSHILTMLDAGGLP